MIESLVTGGEGSVGLAIVELVGGLLAGMLLMFYRDVAATERMFLPTLLFADRLELESEKQWGYAERIIGNEESIQRESSHLLRFRIRSVKAVTFSLGVIVLGSSLALIPIGGLSINAASWILVGVTAGACVEHAVWLFARIPSDIRNLFPLKWPPSGSIS